MYKKVIIFIFLAISFLVLVNDVLVGESRGTGPFSAKVCKAEDGTLFLLQGIQPFPLSVSDQKVVTPFVSKFIHFECNPGQTGDMYSGIKNIRILKHFRDKDFYNSDPETLSIKIQMPPHNIKYPEPIYFSFSLYHERKGPNAWGFSTKFMQAGIWSGGTGCPRLLRTFPINEIWGERYELQSTLGVLPNQHTKIKRSINVLLEPGTYRLVVQERRQQYDGLEKKWKEIGTLIADPATFTVEPEADSEKVKSSLYSWVRKGPISECITIAQKLVSMGEREQVYTHILDDLDTDVIPEGIKFQTIRLVAQYPSEHTVRVLRSQILRSKDEREIPPIISAVYHETEKNQKYMEMIISLLEENRYVKAGPYSQIRISDCVAAYFVSSSPFPPLGSEFFKDKDMKERNKVIQRVKEKLIKELKLLKK